MSNFFDHVDETIEIKKTLFETDKPIDDLSLFCTDDRTIFLQIKRKVSLSVLADGEFYKTIKQFLTQFIRNPRTKDYFGLITTSDSSAKITNDLKKIVGALRLNFDALTDNPLNESESETLIKVTSIFNEIYLNKVNKSPDEKLLKQFLSRIFISVIDIEAGHSVDIASLMLLRGIGFRNPELIWSLMIKNCLNYASKRLSIDQQKLGEIFDLQLKKENINEKKEFDLKTEVTAMGDFPTGKEVLLINSFDPDLDFMLIELFRFTADCRKKGVFSNGNLIIENKDQWKIVQRFATYAGFERFIEENKEYLKGKKLGIIPFRGGDDIESSDCAKLHREYLDSLIEENIDVHLCLHCGKLVTEDNAVIIEVDDLESKPALGLSHKTCIRPVDRIMGRIKIQDREPQPYLETFDFKLWVALILKGQGLMNHLKANPNFLQGKKAVISWNSSEEYDADYSYCIRFNLEDGSSSYAYQRGRIERLNKIEAEKWLIVFNKSLEERKSANDPYSVLSISKDAGTYSQLLTRKKPKEKILEILSIEVSKYSKIIAKLFDRDLSYYAPMCLLRDRETEQFFNMGNVVPILTDPLLIENFFDNWKGLDFEVENLELKIIKTDQDFDAHLRMIFNDGMIPLIDPLFDKNFQLIDGYEIRQFDKMIKEAEIKKQKESQK